MKPGREFFDHAAEAFSYPGAGFRESVRGMGDVVDGDPQYAAAAELVRAFETDLTRFNDTQLEELYTRTFDLNPDLSLETGWQLYGEAYERGSFLVRMRELLRRLEIAETGELPDHLSCMLRALGRLPADEGRELIRNTLTKSLAKIIGRFPEGENPYLKLLRALSVVFEKTSTVTEEART